MRDPKRIDKILGRLAAVWRAHPDLRLGQLVANGAYHVGSTRNPDALVTDWNDPHYIEDEELIAAIEKAHR